MNFCPYCGSIITNPNEPCPKCNIKTEPQSTNKSTIFPSSQKELPKGSAASILPVVLSIISLILAFIYLIIGNNYETLTEKESFILKFHNFFNLLGFNSCGLLALVFGAKDFKCDYEIGRPVMAYILTLVSFILYYIGFNSLSDYLSFIS